MQKKIEFIYTFSFRILKYTCVIFSFFLFLMAFLFSSSDTDISTLKTFVVKDNLFINIMCILLFLGVVLLFRYICNKNPRKTKYTLFFITLGFYAVFGTASIVCIKSTPHTDSHFIYTIAQNFAKNNLADISYDSYLSIYPHQIGLVFFYEPLIRLWNLTKIPVDTYIFLQFVNLLLVLILIIFLYKLVNLLFENAYVTCCTLILTMSCFPLYLYVLRIYGDISSLSFFMVGLWALIKLLTSKTTCKKHKLALYALNIVCFSLSVATRKNTIICLIAIMLIIVLVSLHKKSAKWFPLILIYLLISFFTLPLIQTLYEKRANNTLDSGTPAIAYIAMGMEDAPKASGWYNGFNYNVYVESNHNVEFIKKYCKKKIQARLDYFKGNLNDAFDFYFEKYTSQWCDGTYAIRELTVYSDKERAPYIEAFYSENGGKTFLFLCNQFQNILYLGCFLFTIYSTLIKKEKNLLPFSLILMALGGFFFHFLWEANARAIFTYTILLLPLSGAGMAYLAHNLYTRISKKYLRQNL